MVITELSRKQLGEDTCHVGSNPTLSATNHRIVYPRSANQRSVCVSERKSNEAIRSFRRQPETVAGNEAMRSLL